MALITVKNVNYFYQDGDTKRYILKDISYEFEKGNFYTVDCIQASTDQYTCQPCFHPTPIQQM